jgi:hypothetical protein
VSGTHLRPTTNFSFLPATGFEVEVTLRLTVTQYVLVSSTLVGLGARYYFLSVCCCLRSCFCEAPSLTKGQVCSAIALWLESHRTRNHTLVYHLRLPQPGGPGSHIYIPQEQSGPAIPPGIEFPLRCLLRLTGLQWSYSNPPPTWRARSPYYYPSGTGWSSPKSKSHYDQWSVNQYVLVPSPRGFKGTLSERTSEGVH